MLRLLSFHGNPNVGVFARATEDHVFIPPSLPPRLRGDIQDAVGVPTVTTTIGGTTLVGSLIAANHHGVVVADFATVAELAALRKAGLKVSMLEDRLNAAGNNVLASNTAALCNPAYDDATIKRLEHALKVPVTRGTLGGLGNVGMAGVTTPNGVLVHPKATAEEREHARRVFGRDVMVGTINHGTALIGAGLVANSKGALIGEASTTIEIGRVEDALGFLPTPHPRS